MLKELEMGLPGTYMITILHHNNFVTKKDPFAENKVDTVDIFNWENLELSHLRLSSTVSKKIVHKRILCYKLIQGAVPVLVSEEGIPLTGENIYQHLNKMTTTGSKHLFVFQSSWIMFSGPVCVYPRDSDLKAKVEGFQRKLDQVTRDFI